MKVRSDFVTNSSSSSFIIAKKYLDEDQLEAIRDHHDLAAKMQMIQEDDYHMFPWIIEENDLYITGHVSMDNFSMYSFLQKIEVPMDKVSWDEYEFDIDDPDIDEDKKTENPEELIHWRSLLHNKEISYED